MYSCAHDEFCKRCSIAEYKVSGGLLLDWLDQEEYLWSCGVCPCKMDLGTCCLMVCCNLWKVQSTYHLSQWHRDFRQRCHDEKQIVILIGCLQFRQIFPNHYISLGWSEKIIFQIKKTRFIKVGG